VAADQRPQRVESCRQPADLIRLTHFAPARMISRPFSPSVRRTPPPVSDNVRRKRPLIARRADHHCALLYLRFVASALDAVDAKILTTLDANARLPMSDLGRAVGMSAPSVSDTTSTNELPASANARPMLRIVCSACSRTSVEIIMAS